MAVAVAVAVCMRWSLRKACECVRGSRVSGTSAALATLCELCMGCHSPGHSLFLSSVSQVKGYTGGAPKLGPAPSAGHLRYAFIQTMGPNSVPRDSATADVDGGRITQYAVERPFNELL